MNWFGIFTMLMVAVLFIAVYLHEVWYNKHESDWTMSKEWLDRLEMENRNWSKRNHPTNGDWK